MSEVFEELYKLMPKRNGNVWQWTNQLGKEIQTSYQTEKQILARIKQNLNDIEIGKIKEDGDIFEVEVAEEWYKIAKKNKDVVLDYKNGVEGLNTNGKFGEKLGDIDFGTQQFIAEAKSNLTNSDAIIELENQLKKYMHEYAKTETKYFNGWDRKVVVVCDKLDETHSIIKDLKKKGVIFLKKNEIDKLYN